GKSYGGVVTSDRAKAYDTHPLRARQICWAPLRREFQAMIDRGGAAKATGGILLEHSNVLFAWWHRLREGLWARATLQWYRGHFRQSFRDERARGRQCQCPTSAAASHRAVTYWPPSPPAVAPSRPKGACPLSCHKQAVNLSPAL